MQGDAGPESTFETQSAIVSSARRSGKPMLNAGRGQPNWIAAEPRAAAFLLGLFALDEARDASTHDAWGENPPVAGGADRLSAWLERNGATAPGGAALLGHAVRYGVDELGFDADAWVGELVLGVLGAGYPAPNRSLHHVERVLGRYTYSALGVDASSEAPADGLEIFATEGGAAAMAYVFRSLRESDLVVPGDKVAIVTPIFTPYLQIPLLEEFGFDVVEIHAPHDAAYRLDDSLFERLLDPEVKALVVVNPGNPDSRAIRPERLARLRDLVLAQRPDLIIVSDTVYATFVDGFRGLLAELPRNVICLHSFSKNFGATGNRLGYIAIHTDNVVDELLAAQPDDVRARQRVRYGSVTSDVSTLRFIERLVADSREVALVNIAGLATPDQVQMALFALAFLIDPTRSYIEATRQELDVRLAAVRDPLGLEPPDGADTHYYSMIDLVRVVAVRHGDAVAERFAVTQTPTAVAMQLAADHGVVVLPGELFDADSWDVRVSLASLTPDELGRVAAAILATLSTLVDGG